MPTFLKKNSTVSQKKIKKSTRLHLEAAEAFDFSKKRCSCCRIRLQRTAQEPLKTSANPLTCFLNGTSMSCGVHFSSLPLSTDDQDCDDPCALGLFGWRGSAVDFWSLVSRWAASARRVLVRVRSRSDAASFSAACLMHPVT